MANCEVTIGLPVFNGVEYISDAVDSILTQSYGNFTLVISDNCSDDGTYEICRRYAEVDSRIILHRQPTNIGAVENYKFTLSKCNTPYFMWAAHDDMRSLHDLQYMREAICEKDAVVFGSYIESNYGKNLTPNEYSKNELNKFFVDSFHTGKNHYIYGLFHSDVLMKSDLSLLNHSAPDSIYLLSLLRMGDFRCIKGPVFKYRVVPYSLGWQYAKAKGHFRSLIAPYPLDYYLRSSEIIGHKSHGAKFYYWFSAYFHVQFGRLIRLLRK